MTQSLNRRLRTDSPLRGQTLALHPAQYLATIKADDVKSNIKAMWLMPYDADPILEPEFVGLTQGQVVLAQQFKAAARGDGAAVDRLLDRMVGKPEQVNKNVNLNGTYKDWLEEIAKAEGIINADGNVIDAEATGTNED